jgi:hypothetical protein
MHDHVPSSVDTPRNWSDAFAALPLDTPDAGAWQRVQHARWPRSASRWPKWSALAAVLALAAALPWQLSRTGPAADAAGTGAVAPQPGLARAPETTPVVAAEPVPRATSEALPAAAPGQGAQSAVAAVATRATRTEPARTERVTRARIPAATPGAPDAIDTGIAAAPLVQDGPPAVAKPGAEASLESLYAESAQLEALLALARDDRVATGAAAALSDAYDTQLASIDAALREPALGDEARNALWRQRVDTLRQFAGFESTQRALAAGGERYDAMLVSID